VHGLQRQESDLGIGAVRNFHLLGMCCVASAFGNTSFLCAIHRTRFLDGASGLSVVFVYVFFLIFFLFLKNQLAHMRVGGNQKARAFFRKHGFDSAGQVDKQMLTVK
jgi:hypothetical protein